jgi:hypothetical protein
MGAMKERRDVLDIVRERIGQLKERFLDHNAAAEEEEEETAPPARMPKPMEDVESSSEGVFC